MVKAAILQNKSHRPWQQEDAHWESTSRCAITWPVLLATKSP
jgi:hypothetical protein